MKILRLLSTLFFLSIFYFEAHAQDPEFTQVMGTPMYFNPAFTGIQLNLRTSLQMRDQWESVSGTFVTYAASADMGFPKIHSGAGLIMMRDQAGDGRLSTSTISGLYAYEFKLGLGSYLRAGINASLFQRSIDFGQLRFGDQIDPQKGFVNPSQEKLPSSGSFETSLAPDLSSGILFYNQYLYVGAAVCHIFEPSQSFFGNVQSELLRRYDLQSGGFIQLGEFVLNPYILAMHQGNFTQVLPGINATRGMFTVGTSFRQTDPNADAVNFLFGFAKGKFKFCYSYDITVSDARAAAAGSQEFTMVFQLNKPRETSHKPMINRLRNAF
jgi:type IX secretion system PorP/SprF family membrane protein